ncbi:MAG: PAS domain S-box protein [Sulfuritalea sp.]|nr:PAS domain S-box protein [Sulfuritalea sp.]
MNPKQVPPHSREAAETQLERASAAPKPARSAEELLHELQVHQVELEAQNQELRRAQTALEESRDCYLDLYDFAPIGYLTLTGNGSIAAVNLVGANLLGMPRAELINRRFANFVLPDDRARWQLYFFRRLQDGSKEYGEFVLQCGGGSRFHARLDCVRMVVDGKSAELRLALTDITEQKSAEAELRANEARYRAVTESATDAIVTVDSAGNIAGWNPACERLFGYTAAEISGQSLTLLMPRQFRQRHQEGLQKRLADDTAPLGGKAVEVLGLRKNGCEFPLELSLARWASDHNCFFTGFMRDITLRKTAEEQLRKLSLAVEQSPESIAITNIDAELEYVNQAFIETTGYSREEAIGQNPKILHSGKTPKETYEALWQALTHGRMWKGEFQNKRKDGSEYVELAIIKPLRQADGKISHYVAVKEDITRQKQLGLELDAHRHHLEELVAQRTTELVAAREAAEAANRAKSVFLANMSHELRTPMNGIMGMTDLVLRRATDPQQIDWLNKSKASAQRLLAIINDILDLSKIEAGRLPLEGKDFRAASILNDVAFMIGPAARDKGLRIDVEPDALPLWLRGDPARLRQALLNLAGNAVKFTGQGSVTLRALQLHEKGDTILVRFEVTDTGIGISGETLRRIFSAFEQADNSITRKYGGTGLGLAITRRLAELMGGEVGADSTPGIGSTFWFTARLQRGHGAPPAATAGSRADAPEPTRGSSSPSAPDAERAMAALKQLEPLLVRDDTLAGDLFELNRPLLVATLGDAAQQLERQVAAFDYPAALATVRELIRQTPKT